MLSSRDISSATPVPPVAWQNGHWIPASQLSISAIDLGFIHGVTVAEQMRTFRGQIFLLDRHLERWQRGLDLLGIVSTANSRETLREMLTRLVNTNQSALSPNCEQGVCLFATPGDHAPFAWETVAPSDSMQMQSAVGHIESANVAAHSYRLPVERWQERYQSGATLVTVTTREVPVSCWPKNIKARSRLNYYLAEREARATHPQAWPLLLDQNDCIGDSSIASIVAFQKGNGLILPDDEGAFQSMSVQFVEELARQLNLNVNRRPLTRNELAACDEIMLVTTPWCILPVTQRRIRSIDSCSMLGNAASEYVSPISKILRRESDCF
jgi:branched-chain amino acid aminotransferase